MLIGYVSDERYQALADVQLEFCNARGESWELRSRASGSVHGELPPDDYVVTLSRAGFGSKRVPVSIRPGFVHQFRLLADRLLGYAWPRCVRSGESAEFRVHSVEPYHLELWRYGYAKTRLASLGWFDEHAPRAVMQVTPDGDYTQEGVAWNKTGYGSTVHQQKVKGPSQPGLYYFHATTAAGESFAFPWVVAPSAPAAGVAVLASDLTWNAYNAFGGRSNYLHADALPPSPTVNARQELRRYLDPSHHSWGAQRYARLSFDRPEPINHIELTTQAGDPIVGRSACHVAPADWRLLAWLEREGFAYDLYSETQLHRGVLDLSAYRVLILGAHPEYWTRTMYDNVKRWVFEHGGRLMYLGGNGLNCEVELADDGTMTVCNGAIPSLWPDGIGAESRFALRHESEARLLGVVFTPSGIMTAAPYRVVDGAHWLFSGTGLRSGDLFGTESLHERCPGGASGHETDKMSPSSPPGTRLLAKGTNPDDGGAEMVVFDTPNGGSVFSVGSICYVSSLLIDAGVSQITKNALQRFLS